jgi:hypothetical protein
MREISWMTRRLDGYRFAPPILRAAATDYICFAIGQAPFGV